MKKLIALLLAVCMVACLFAGCGEKTPEETTAAPEETTAAPETEPVTLETEAPTTAPTEEEKEPVTLTFWQAGGDTVGASSIMRLLLDKFEMMYPWITVDYQAIPWSADPHTQFQTAIAGGECADVLVLGSPLDFQLAGEGNLLALDDLLDESVLNDMSDVLKNECIYWGGNNEEMYGKMMSLPLYGGGRAMLYNKEIFDFFGVEYPTEGMTHADLLEMAKKLTGDMNGKKVYGLGTRATTSEQYLNFVWNYGAKIIDPATMTAATDSEEWRKGIEDYLAFYEAGVTPEGAVNMDGTTLLQLFMNGEVAMFIAAVDYAIEIDGTAVAEGETPWSEKLGIAPLVGQDYATCYCGADVLAVPSTTQHIDEAALLLNYLMGTEAQSVYCKNVGFFPGVKSAAADPYFSENYIQKGFADVMEGAHYFGNYGVSCGTLLKANIQMLLNGEVTIEEYQANLTAEINAAAAEMNG
jgi:multiple sugar transport system substrate-binding protein